PAAHAAYRQTCRVDLSELFWRATTAKRDSGHYAKPGLQAAEIKIPSEGRREGIQKILLGLLVRYPYFLRLKSDLITSVHFTAKLEAFRGALYELLIDAVDIDVNVIYERLPAAYYDILNDVHGDHPDRSKRGHRLIRRFPILELLPSD